MASRARYQFPWAFNQLWPWSTLWAGYAASAWAFMFAMVSFYWAAGGTAGVETIGDVITKPALAGDPMMIAILWGSGIVKIIAGLLALALVQSWSAQDDSL